MRILFIGKRFYTNRDALRERYGRIFKLPSQWRKAGFESRLWLVDYHTNEFVSECCDGMNVTSTPVRGLHLIRQYYAEISGDSERGLRPTVVIASGDCYIGLLALRLATRLGAKFVFDVYDKYDEFGGYYRLPGFDPFQFLLTRADTCFFASHALMEKERHRTQCSVVVSNGIDPSYFMPGSMDTSRAEFGLPSDAIFIGYFGSLTPDRGPGDLIHAVERLRRLGLQINLVLAGKLQGVSIPNEPWIRYLGNLPYKKIPSAMSCCDLLALPYRRSKYLDMASSCKIAEYIALGKPIVATDTPNFSKNFPSQAAQLGSLLASPGDPDDLARAISGQLLEKRLVSLPIDLTWHQIAADALCHLRNISGD